MSFVVTSARVSPQGRKPTAGSLPPLRGRHALAPVRTHPLNRTGVAAGKLSASLPALMGFSASSSRFGVLRYQILHGAPEVATAAIMELRQLLRRSDDLRRSVISAGGDRMLLQLLVTTTNRLEGELGHSREHLCVLALHAFAILFGFLQEERWRSHAHTRILPIVRRAVQALDRPIDGRLATRAFRQGTQLLEAILDLTVDVNTGERRAAPAPSPPSLVHPLNRDANLTDKESLLNVQDSSQSNGIRPIVFVRLSWLLERGKAVQEAQQRGDTKQCAYLKLPGRSELPDEAVVDDDADFMARMTLFVVCHPWYEASHPDPFGDQLVELAQLVERARSEYPEFPHPEDACVVYDYCCLHQRCEDAGSGGDGRSQEERFSFKLGLLLLNNLYAHRESRVLVLSASRPPPRQPRDDVAVTAKLTTKLHRKTTDKELLDRGWPFFEVCAAHLSKRSFPTISSPLPGIFFSNPPKEGLKCFERRLGADELRDELSRRSFTNLRNDTERAIATYAALRTIIEEGEKGLPEIKR